MASLGLKAKPEDVNALFDLADSSRSGQVEHAVLTGLLALSASVSDLRNALSENKDRLGALLAGWDEDGTGIGKKDFRRLVAALGLKLERRVVDKLFEGVDADGSGTVEAGELLKAATGQTRHAQTVVPLLPLGGPDLPRGPAPDP